MRRPLLYAALAVCLTLLAAMTLPINFTVALLILLAAAALACLLMRKRPLARSILPMLLAAAAAGLYLLLLTVGQVWPLQSFAGGEAQVSGVIVEEPEHLDEQTRYILKVDTTDLADMPGGFKLLVSDRTAMDAKAFDRYNARVYLYAPLGSSRSACYAKGVYLCGRAVSGQSVEKVQKYPPYFLAIRIRQYIRNFFDTHLSAEEAACMNGLLLGDKSGMPASLRADLRDSGVSHIMAVSGMHLAVLCQGLLFALRKLRMGRRLSLVAAMAAVCLMMAVTGFSASIMRAGIMYLLLLAGRIIFRRADALNSLGAAVLVLMAFNPFTAGDLSFQLSVCATLGVLLLCPRLYGWMEARLSKGLPGRLLRPPALALSQALSCMLFTLPVILLRLDQFSLVAPLTNLAVSFAASAALLCGTLAVLCFLFPPLVFIGYPLLLAAGLLVRYIAGAAGWFASLPFATASTAYPYLQLWMAAAFLLAALTLLLPGRKKRLCRMAALLTALLLCIGGVSYAAFTHNVTRITLLDTDAGLSVFLSRNGRCALVGAGGKSVDGYAVRRSLRATGTGRLDLAVLPALETDYTGGMALLARSCPIDMLVSPDGEAYAASLGLPAETRLQTLDGGSQVRLWGDVTLCPADCGERTGLYLTVGQTCLLILPGPVHLGELPAEYAACHVLLTTADPIGGLVSAAIPVGLVSGNEELGPRAAARLTAEGLSAYATGGNGNLTIATRGRGDITLRREGA
ncbi:MAG: DUF4131 domain-containing protein [Clostridiales bacterium]|nr:DUF4131 domain-containing protein [Clostridiales bacterium]